MGKSRIESLDGGIPQLIVEGIVADNDSEVFALVSHASKKWKHMLVNLQGLKECSAKFFLSLEEVSARTNLKAISTDQKVIGECNKLGIPVFPTLKSASLSFAGDETISLLLRKLKDVPILNTEAYKLIGYVSLPDASFPVMERMIKDNPGLCSQIFRWANSSYFSRQKKAETLSQALVTLGFSNLRQLFVYNFYNSIGTLFQTQAEVIEHGRKCGQLAEFICKGAGSQADECAKVRMGGLLHDIGRMALSFFFPDHYARVRKLIEEKVMPSYVAEMLVFGTEHQAIGSLLCNKWNFPAYLSAIIGDHHYLQAANWNTLTLPVYIASNFLAEQEKTNFNPYYSRLEGYFFIKKKEIPWKDFTAEFISFISTHADAVF